MKLTTLIAPCVLALPLVLLCAPCATADVNELIAQFPANDMAHARAQFEGLLNEGEDALEDLCDRLVPMGGGDDSAARYALTGLARYASRPDAGEDREIVEEALLEGLEGAEDPEVRAFLLRQLQQCGTNETVSEINELLENEALASHVILALDAIDTRRARRTLVRGLGKTGGDTQLEILAALADEGANWRVARTLRNRLESATSPDEYVQLLSMLVMVAGEKSHKDLIVAMERNESRVRKAALGHAATMMNASAARRWRKALRDNGLPEDVKTAIEALLAANGGERGATRIPIE